MSSDDIMTCVLLPAAGAKPCCAALCYQPLKQLLPASHPSQALSDADKTLRHCRESSC